MTEENKRRSKVGTLITVVLTILIAYILAYEPMDETDKSFFKRSGMRLYIDYKTGCHYVGGRWGGITPRLSANGNQICDPKHINRRGHG